MDKKKRAAQGPVELFLIGYECYTLDQFLLRLKLNEIGAVIDVRDLPASRKRGFSKKALEASLEEAGVAYIHRKDLGTPKPLRDKVKKDRDYRFFFREFKKVFEERGEPVGDILELSISKRCCIMCYEHNLNRCHRKVIIEKVMELDPGIRLIALE